MQKVEFLIAWEDHTWTTEIVEVEEDERVEDWDEWARRNLVDLPKYRKAILITLYSAFPEED